MADELKALMAAPAIDPYTGPAILESEAAGVLFHEAVGHRLEGERLDDDKEGQTFQGQVGQVVLPTFLTVLDDPTPGRRGRHPAQRDLRSTTTRAIPAQRAALIEGGKLIGFLLSRRPVKPFTHSNGHGRSQGLRPAMARMANLVVESSRRLGAAALKQQLMAEARRQGKPYGLLIRDITGGNTNTQSWGYQAFKGTPRLVYRVDATTGAETLVRGVELVGHAARQHQPDPRHRRHPAGLQRLLRRRERLRADLHRGARRCWWASWSCSGWPRRWSAARSSPPPGRSPPNREARP